MAKAINSSRRFGSGFLKALLVMVGTIAAGEIAYAAAAQLGQPPMFFAGAAGGAIIGAFAYSLHRKATVALNAPRAGSPHSADRLEFDPPRPAKVTHPPYEKREHDVLAVDTNADGNLPFRVWVEDGKEEWHPFYATAVEFLDEEA
jgi:hypothetical protein